MAVPTRRRDGGASLVEFAFILPLFVVLIFGMITGGIVLSEQNSVRNAVRETSRFGAVVSDFPEGTDPVPTELADLYGQLVDAATGDLDPDVDRREICVAMIDGTNKWWWQFYTDSATPTASGAGQTIDDVAERCKAGFDTTLAATTQRIWVRASRKSEINAIFFDVPVTLDAKSTSRYER